MEPKNWWFVDVSPFPRGYFQVPAVSFQGFSLDSFSGQFLGGNLSLLASGASEATEFSAYPLVPPLPSYGLNRDWAKDRFLRCFCGGVFFDHDLSWKFGRWRKRLLIFFNDMLKIHSETVVFFFCDQIDVFQSSILLML